MLLHCGKNDFTKVQYNYTKYRKKINITEPLRDSIFLKYEDIVGVFNVLFRKSN